MSNHSNRSIFRSKTRYTLIVLAMFGGMGCDDGAARLDAEQAADLMLSAEESQYISDLAQRYLFSEVDDEGAGRIEGEIGELSPSGMRHLNKELQRLGDADPYQTQVADRLTELAIERGTPMLNVSKDDLDAVLAELGDIEVSPRALCSTWTPSPKTFLAGFNSTATGVTAVMSDRRSTGWYEFGGCDHRFYFPGTRTKIDGKSAAYDKWIASYSSILGQHTGAGTYAVMGNGKAIANWIFNVDYSMVKAY